MKLLAPNGKPSNLNEQQWQLVRTPEFKRWFGDWEKLAYAKLKDAAMDEVTLENLSKNVSKVVDENYEPLVVYHFTDKKFNVFEKRGLLDGFFFTPYKKDREFDYGKRKKYFLNIKKMSELKDMPSTHWSVPFYENKWIAKSKLGGGEGIRFIKEVDNKEIYVAFNSNQIKLADGTNTTFDSSNPDIRFAKGGQIYSEISKEINEVNALSKKDLTPMQLQYLNKKLLFFTSDKMNTLKETNKKLWEDLWHKQRKVRDILDKKETKKGVAGYLNEKYAYHFTTIFNLKRIVEDKSIGHWQELGRVISLTTNPIFGEAEVSGVKNWNQGMNIRNAQFFSDLSVKIVFDLQKIKADGVKITRGSGKTGTHFGEYELIIPQFNEKDKWWKYVSWIEIDTNKKEIKELLDYEWVKERNIKDVMQVPIDIWIKGKQAESTLGLELKKLGIEVREREKIDVEKYLFGGKKPKYEQGGNTHTFTYTIGGL